MTLKEYLEYLLEDIYEKNNISDKKKIINEIVETLIKEDISDPTEFIKNFLKENLI